MAVDSTSVTRGLEVSDYKQRTHRWRRRTGVRYCGHKTRTNPNYEIYFPGNLKSVSQLSSASQSLTDVCLNGRHTNVLYRYATNRNDVTPVGDGYIYVSRSRLQGRCHLCNIRCRLVRDRQPTSGLLVYSNSIMQIRRRHSTFGDDSNRRRRADDRPAVRLHAATDPPTTGLLEVWRLARGLRRRRAEFSRCRRMK
jgi:hypothetical protein